MTRLTIKYEVILALLLGLTLQLTGWGCFKTWANETIHQAKTVTNQKPIVTEEQGPQISVQNTQDGTSLFIDTHEVLKFRSTSYGMSPEQRAKVVQQRLTQFLNAGGNPREIRPGEEGKQIVIRMGEGVLATINPATAKKEKMSVKQLAFLWSNQVRTALGADPLTRDPSLMASRGFSPALGALRLGNIQSTLKGYASWYGPGFNGHRAANGERFNMHALTAAHRTLPLNSMVRVINTRNGKSAVVRITDRGPYVHGRIIDLSKGAASAIGMLSSGTAPVVVEVLGR